MRDRGGAYPPLVELTLARLREFLREPEALFWVFVFPDPDGVRARRGVSLRAATSPSSSAW